MTSLLDNHLALSDSRELFLQSVGTSDGLLSVRNLLFMEIYFTRILSDFKFPNVTRGPLNEPLLLCFLLFSQFSAVHHFSPLSAYTEYS